MEFGTLGEFIKILEERFGKFWSSSLIFIAALGIAALSVEAIYRCIILIYRAVKYVTGSHSLYDLLVNQFVSILYTTIITLVLCVVGWEIFSHWYKNQLRKLTREARDYVDKDFAKIERYHNQLTNIIKEVQELVEKQSQVQAELERKVG